MRKPWLRKGLWLSAGLVALSACLPSFPAKAAEKEIRVALFIESGQGYRNIVPDVTLTSETGFELELRGDREETGLPDLDEEMMRVRMDEYYLVAKETGNLQEAERIAQQLSLRNWDASIQQEERRGKTVYLVVSGSYDTYAAAAAQLQAVAQVTGSKPEVRGPYRLEADRFRSEKQAKEWEQAFEEEGIAAHVAIIGQDDDPEYAVWLGDEISRDKLDALKRKAEDAFSSFSYREVKEAHYVVVKQDVLAGEADPIRNYTVSPHSELVIAPQDGRGTAVLGVEERERRRYRGTMAVSEHNGQLALINELPLEAYLYGVVGTEMASGWPIEALKAQAVLARTRAVGQKDKYGVADVVDTVLDQAYYGYEREAADIRRAVDQTRGMILTYRGKPVEALYSSNAGGTTAEGEEVWGNPVPYLRAVTSPDSAPAEAAPIWYQAVLPDGTIGYVRHDFVQLTGNINPLGLQQGVITTHNLNFRSGPSTVYHKVIRTLPAGTQITIIAQEPEENAYAWTRGPYSAQEITAMINASQARNKAPLLPGPVDQLQVTKQGPSGRVLELVADGMILAASSPDAHRSIFKQGESTLRSNKFTIEQTGTFTVMGANQQTVSYTHSGNIMALSAAYGLTAANGYADAFLLYDAAEQWRVVTKQPAFVLRGNGNGHGLGLSQYGAKALAEQGYDYKEILQHYYEDIKIER